jgi:hypothetical protein
MVIVQALPGSIAVFEHDIIRVVIHCVACRQEPPGQQVLLEFPLFFHSALLHFVFAVPCRAGQCHRAGIFPAAIRYRHLEMPLHFPPHAVISPCRGVSRNNPPSGRAVHQLSCRTLRLYSFHSMGTCTQGPLTAGRPSC